MKQFKTAWLIEIKLVYSNQESEILTFTIDNTDDKEEATKKALEKAKVWVEPNKKTKLIVQTIGIKIYEY